MTSSHTTSPSPAASSSSSASSPTGDAPPTGDNSPTTSKPWWWGELDYPHQIEILHTVAKAAVKVPRDRASLDDPHHRRILIGERFWKKAQEAAEQLQHDPSLLPHRHTAALAAWIAKCSAQQIPHEILERAKLDGGHLVKPSTLLGILYTSTLLGTGAQSIELDAVLADALMRSDPAPSPFPDDPCPHLPFTCLYIAFTDRAPRTDDGLIANVLTTRGPRNPSVSPSYFAGSSEVDELTNTILMDIRGLYVWEHDSRWLFYAAAPTHHDDPHFEMDAGFFWIMDWRITPTIADLRAAYEELERAQSPAPQHNPLSWESEQVQLNTHIVHAEVRVALVSLVAVLSQYLASSRARTIVREPQEALDLEAQAALLPKGGKRHERLMDLSLRIRRRTLRTIRLKTPDALQRAHQLQLLDAAAQAQAHSPLPREASNLDTTTCDPPHQEQAVKKRSVRGHWVRGHIRMVWTGPKHSDERKQAPRYVFPFYKPGSALLHEGAIDRIRLPAPERSLLMQQPSNDDLDDDTSAPSC
jgi:hypothetical protein